MGFSPESFTVMTNCSCKQINTDYSADFEIQHNLLERFAECRLLTQSVRIDNAHFCELPLQSLRDSSPSQTWGASSDYPYLSILNSQFSVFRFQLSVFNSQFSVFNFQFSILSFPFSTLNSHFSILNSSLLTPHSSFLIPHS